MVYAYAFLGYASLKVFTPDFAQLLRTEYELESAYRNSHARLRQHAESVAFFGGGEKEGSVISGAFNRLTGHLRGLTHQRWMYGAAEEFFAKQLPHNITWLLSLLYALDQSGEVIGLIRRVLDAICC